MRDNAVPEREPAGETGGRSVVYLAERLIEPLPEPRIQVLAPLPRDRQRASLSIEFLPAARLETILPAWQALSADSLDDNPFLSPAFLLPLIQHDLTPADLMVALVWRTAGDSRSLVGFQPLRPAVRAESGSVFSFGAREALAWSHPWQSVSMPLLAAGEALADAALRVLLKGVAALRHRPDALCWSAAPASSHFCRLLAATATSLGLAVRAMDSAPETLGLDFHPTWNARLRVPEMEMNDNLANAPALLERILVREAETGYDPLVHDPASAGFVRAMTRGLAADGRLLLVLSPEGPQALGAIVIASHSRSWLWRAVGPGVGHPQAEAALIMAIGRKLGQPVSPANGRRLTGIGLDIGTLKALRIELKSSPGGLPRRIGGGLLPPAPPARHSGSAAA